MKYEIELKDGAIYVNTEGQRFVTMTRHEMTEAILHAVPVKEVEPLAVLAARKGFAYIYTDGYHKRNKFEVTEISIFESITEGGSTSGEYCFHAQSYAEAESKARAYLNGLPDVKREGI